MIIDINGKIFGHQNTLFHETLNHRYFNCL